MCPPPLSYDKYTYDVYVNSARMIARARAQLFAPSLLHSTVRSSPEGYLPGFFVLSQGQQGGGKEEERSHTLKAQIGGKKEEGEGPLLLSDVNYYRALCQQTQREWEWRRVIEKFGESEGWRVSAVLQWMLMLSERGERGRYTHTSFVGVCAADVGRQRQREEKGNDNDGSGDSGVVCNKIRNIGRQSVCICTRNMQDALTVWSALTMHHTSSSTTTYSSSSTTTIYSSSSSCMTIHSSRGRDHVRSKERTTRKDKRRYMIQ
eukprot:GHVQ01008727.1.p1 GENE.GHVQ01008727.1~~GHVQ01008727.1.p1  ORF type:complete len:294 (+),score=73.68 GHVQ01008727.1:97-882(+)